MITWLGNFTAFYNYVCTVHDGSPGFPSMPAIHLAAEQFATHFNCEVTCTSTRIAFVCTEEDLLVIKLQCPEAVDHIL